MNPSIHREPFFNESAELQAEAWRMATEAISRLLIWMTDGRTLERRGLRASVAIYCVRPDLLECATLDDLGALAGCSKQAVHKHVVSFRRATGFPAWAPVGSVRNGDRKHYRFRAPTATGA